MEFEHLPLFLHFQFMWILREYCTCVWIFKDAHFLQMSMKLHSVWSPCQWSLTHVPVNVSVYHLLILAGSTIRSHSMWTLAGMYLPWAEKLIF